MTWPFISSVNFNGSTVYMSISALSNIAGPAPLPNVDGLTVAEISRRRSFAEHFLAGAIVKIPKVLYEHNHVNRAANITRLL